MTKETMGDVVDAFIADRAERYGEDGACAWNLLRDELEAFGEWWRESHYSAPSEASGDVVEADAKLESIWIQWSDCGNHIRRWQRAPFDGGEEIAGGAERR